MKTRELGFDLARAYAIFGMYVVNFTFCFGRFNENSFLGSFPSLFVGNSTSIFIICAGMGVVLLTESTDTTASLKQSYKSILLRRSWFLFGMGILLYSWWPGDILHFYGGYLHLAAFLVFIPKKNYLWISLLCILIYNVLQYFIPITTGWNLHTTKYSDFWSIKGFARNTFFNGWNSIFPWFSYFAVGMYLGKVNWKDPKTLKRIFIVGLISLVIFKGLRIFIKADMENPSRNTFYIKYWFHLMEDYFPANIPFMMITLGFALMIISTCMYVGQRFSKNVMVVLFSKTGQMTLTLYVFHITIGMFVLSKISGIPYTGYLPTHKTVSAAFILSYAVTLFATSVFFCQAWTKRFKKGPLETLMRNISG